MLEIVSLDSKPVVLKLKNTFRISVRETNVSETILIRLRLRNGIVGYGEAVPLTYISNETPESVSNDLAKACELLDGRPVSSFRKISLELRKEFPESIAALAGIEMALIDAFCKSKHIPAWQFFGGYTGCITTDATIPILDIEHSAKVAAELYCEGFDCLKIKADKDCNASRLASVAEAAPGAIFIIDANQAFDADSALDFFRFIPFNISRIVAFEQPVDSGNLEALKKVCDSCTIPVFADESAKTVFDVARIAKTSSADGVNIKIQKLGFIGSIESAAICRASGIKLMLGCMLESAIGLSASVHFACGMGCFDHIDLDSDILIGGDFGQPGFIRKGPEIAVLDLPGFGAEPPESIFD